jgi:hypothetical protein
VRDLDIRAQRFTLLRFTDRPEEEPGRVDADVARALAQEGRLSKR